MRQQLGSVMTNLDNLEAIVGKLRDGTDAEATMVLARLRLGAPIGEVVQAISTEARQKKLIERFMQAAPKTNETYGGSGLGLSISRKLVQLHGGDIGVHSK
jgi:light-regulated signal transduction histidine kinase (bacteriophytochrome)